MQHEHEDNRSSRGQNAMIAALLLMVLICGVMLYRNRRPVYAEPAETVPAVTETTAAVSGTAAESVTALQTTTAAAVTEPDDRSLYLQYLNETLIPAYGLADDSGVLPCAEQTGLAGAYFADLSGRGADDLLVIRLEMLDAEHAAAPVFEWYTLRDGAVTLLDSFSCKMPWSDIAVRYSGDALYVSASDIPLDENAENRKYAELKITLLDGDMQTADLQQEYGNAKRPPVQYPADAVLLLTVEPDRTQKPAVLSGRRYLLTDYTGLREQL